MKYLTNDRNSLRQAAITASNIQASTAVYRTALSRTGGGLVRLTGGYSGQADATFDVEVLNTTIVGTPRVSAPSFVGVGNGTMTGVVAPSGMPAQEWTVTLIDLGTDTRKAYVPFQGVTLRARASGAGGNLITITVNEAALTTAATSYSLLEPLRAGVNEYVGQQWSFGAAVLNPDGTIPAGAPRVRFGADPQVYRAYKFFRDGQYVHAFAPAPVRDVDAGAVVSTVSGARTVTVTNGTTTNTYTGITTLFSLLTAINGDPAGLLEVAEPVTNDLSPAGMGAVDLSIQTRSFVASLSRDGTQFVREAEIGLGVGATSPTETLTIRCADAGIPGAERWTVSGTVSGARVGATTGVPYADGGITFTIPVRLPPGESPAGEHTAAFKITRRPPGEDVPSMCYENLVAGAEAQAKTYVFVWERRPGEACECDTSGIIGGPVDEYLGIDVDTGGDTVASIPAALQSRTEDLYEWRSTFIAGNTSLLAHNATITDDSVSVGAVTVAEGEETGTKTLIRERVSAILRADRVDINAAKAVTAIFYGTIKRIHDDLAPTSIPAPVLAAWDTAFTNLQTDFNVIGGNVGAEFWRLYSAQQPTPSGAEPNALQVKESGRLLSRAFDLYLERYKAQMDHILTLAGIEPDFEGAARQGNGVWQDRGGDYWFASQDGLLPLFPGYYYHSARLGQSETGEPEPVSTREFGIGVDIGCPELLVEGDRIEITLGPVANLRQTYQAGDTIEATIINGAPVQLGGGQTGNDTLTWSVVGSVDGARANYGLNKLSPSAYLVGGLGFLISPAGVPFALGDRFTFRVEGGQFRWRRNGGAWSAATQIGATVALTDGLSAAFEPGSAPSFQPGDAYIFRAEAAFGAARGVVPTDERLVWTGATVIDWTPPAALRPVRELVIFDHTIPNTATLRLQGSNNGFATTPYDQPVPWAAGTIQHVLPATITYDRYRLTVSTAGSAQWIWAGEALTATIASGRRELGRLTKRRRLPGVARSAGQGVQVEHTALTQASVDALIASLSHATGVDAGRLGILPNDAEPSAAIVRLDADTLEVRDELEFQPRNTGARLLSVTLDLAPTP